MLKFDDLQIEILEDGRVKVTTPGISGVNHKNADELLKFMSQQLGGAVEKQKNKKTHTHHKQHQHAKATR